MKTMVIGDIHGRVEIVEKALATEYPLIFVGDYLDSWNRSVVDQIKSLELVLDAIKNNRAVGILGNHEMSYLNRSCRCSGFSNATSIHIMSMDLKPLVDYVYCEGFLISHAGVSQLMLDYNKITLEQYLKDKKFEDVGYSRGGWSPIGGLRWCDWSEFKPIESQPQIVGHTIQRSIQQKDNSYCIDVLESSSNNVLLIENGSVEIIEL